MSNESATIVQRLWNYCNVLRDDGVSYGDYVEQLTYLLFLKMDDEQTKPPFGKKSSITIAVSGDGKADKESISYERNDFWTSTSNKQLKCFTYEEIIQRDKVSLDILWLKDDSIEDSANLPDPDELAQDIVENLEDALEQFKSINKKLGK